MFSSAMEFTPASAALLVFSVLVMLSAGWASRRYAVMKEKGKKLYLAACIISYTSHLVGDVVAWSSDDDAAATVLLCSAIYFCLQATVNVFVMIQDSWKLVVFLNTVCLIVLGVWTGFLTSVVTGENSTAAILCCILPLGVAAIEIAVPFKYSPDPSYAPPRKVVLVGDDDMHLGSSRKTTGTY